MINNWMQTRLNPLHICYLNLPVVISPQDIDEMHSILETLENNSSTKILIIRGKDPNKFCHGMNLKYLKKYGIQAAIRLAESLMKVCGRILMQNCPILCVINGHAIAAGLAIAMCSDYLIMSSDSGTLGMTEILINFIIPRPIMMLLKEKISPADFRDLIIRPKTFSTKEALRAKIIDEAVPKTELQGRALRLVEEMIENKDEYLTARKIRIDRHTETIKNLQIGDFGIEFFEAMVRDGVKI